MDTSQPHNDGIRLNKLLAEALGISRREADEAIEHGLVTINGELARLGSRVQRADDMVCYKDAPVGIESHAYRYIVLHKPVGYVCSRKQQGDAPTIYSLLPSEMASLKPVGRLDKDSSGIILLTDDGDFAHLMTHPRYAKVKRYEVTLNTPLQPLHQQMISDNGVLLPDGPSKFSVSSIEGQDVTYEVILREGRNRQIRRTFAALGYEVAALHRTSFGPYELNDLAVGKQQSTRRL